MIENLPRDHAPLDPDAEEVLRALYDEFDKTSAPVMARPLAYRLRDRVKNVQHLLARELGSYLRTHRANDDQGYTPRLRATLRLGREDDLRLVDSFYELINQKYRPERPYLTGAELRAFTGSDQRLKRLEYLIGDEMFVSFRTDAPDRDPAAYIRDEIIDAPTLTEFLVGRYRGARTRSAAPVPRAQVWLRALQVQGFRTYQDVSIDHLGAFTAFTGRNDVGKTNLRRALQFVSNFASGGPTRALGPERSLRTLLPRTRTPAPGQINLTAILETDADWVSYSMRLKQTGKSVVDGEHLSTLRGPPPPEEIARRLVDQQETLARINDREVMHLARDESALASLHDVQLHREAMAIREGLRAWSFFHFEPSSLRLDHPKDDLLFQRTGHDFELHESGADLARALSRLGTTDPDRLKAIGAAFQALIPEAERVEAQIGLDGRPLILLQERGLTDPFSQHDLSDGLLRILALLYLAHHPEPPTLVFVEEPENGLYPRLIEALADVLLSLSQRTQVMITTHSVQLLNRLTPDQVVFVSRTDRGSQLTRLQTRRDVIEAAAEFGVGDQLRMGHIEGQ